MSAPRSASLHLRARPLGFSLLLGGALAACGPRGHGESASSARLDGVSRCEYLARVVNPRPLLLDVTATCRGRGVRGLEADEARVADSIGAVSEGGQRLARKGEAFLLPHAESTATFQYRVDLDRQVAERPSIDQPFRTGESLLSPASNFLLYPLPLDVGIEIDLRVETPQGMGFVSALARSGDHYRLQAHEIAVGTYSAFGALQRRNITLAGDPAQLELAVLDGELSVNPDQLAAWLKERAEAVAHFYRGFPAPKALVVALPAPKRRDVVFGKLLPASGPGIALLLGSRADEAALHDDWLLVHELFHLGVPSFSREGKWFDEGLATYFEPIIRVRAGLYDEKSLWRDFVLGMPPALPALTQTGLEHTRNYTELYWGGAIYCLLADIAVRSATQGRLGLEDGIRRVQRAGGQASQVWALANTLRVADEAFPTAVLAPLAARYGQTPGSLDLEQIFRSLGVERSARGLVLSDDAPLAWVRRAILTPVER